MITQKTLLAFIISASFYSFANNYIVFIDDNDVHNYDNISLIEYSEWQTLTFENCSVNNDWNPEDVYNGFSYDKITSCQENQERNKYYYNYINDEKVLIKTEIENKTIDADDIIESFVGTKKAKSCLDILNSHGSTGDGNYTITVNSTDFIGFCDMTTDGGGWTLAMRLKNSGQLTTGSLNRNNFWNSGSTMNGYVTNTFSKLELSDTGFLGWDRIKSMLDSSHLNINIRGVNSLSENINENYILNNFFPVMTNSTIEGSSLDNGGVYTIAKMSDTNARSNWGTCGVNSADQGYVAHYGIGLCTNGYNNNAPTQREVQIWHYGDYNYNMNVSFGSESSGNTYNYNLSKTFDLMMFIK